MASARAETAVPFLKVSRIPGNTVWQVRETESLLDGGVEACLTDQWMGTTEGGELKGSSAATPQPQMPKALAVAYQLLGQR